MENDYNTFAKALNIAGVAHRTQVRNGKIDGKKVSYMIHPFKVCYAVSVWSQGNYRIMSTAILHDVLEDSPDNRIKYYEKKILELGDDILQTVKILTKGKQEPYEDYIQRIVDSKNLAAVVIKISDICANINDSELFFGEISEKVKNKAEIIVKKLTPIVSATDTPITPLRFYAELALDGIDKKVNNKV